MADELVFYTNPMSRGRIVRWMLEEVGRPYRAEIVRFGPEKSPELLAVNPMGKVPTIVHRGQVVTEAAAICAYLADAFPEAGLAPAPNSSERGAYYRWLFFAAGPLEQAVTNRAMGFEPPADKRGMVGYGSYDDTIDTLEKAVGGRQYLARDRFSAADLYVASHLAWGMGFGTIDKRPAFERYIEPMVSRPAALRADEIDNGLIAQMQAMADA